MSQIRRAGTEDVPAMVDLSEQKRRQYQAYQPLFWRQAADSREKQSEFLAHAVTREHTIALVLEQEGRIDGFVVAVLVAPPPVYSAGLTCLIDDFCVAHQDWQRIGTALLGAVTNLAKERGAAQSVVVCGHLDEPKRQMLSASGHTIASEWWVRPI